MRLVRHVTDRTVSHVLLVPRDTQWQGVLHHTVGVCDIIVSQQYHVAPSAADSTRLTSKHMQLLLFIASAVTSKATGANDGDSRGPAESQLCAAVERRGTATALTCLCGSPCLALAQRGVRVYMRKAPGASRTCSIKVGVELRGALAGRLRILARVSLPVSAAPTVVIGPQRRAHLWQRKDDRRGLRCIVHSQVVAVRVVNCGPPIDSMRA